MALATFLENHDGSACIALADMRLGMRFHVNAKMDAQR